MFYQRQELDKTVFMEVTNCYRDELAVNKPGNIYDLPFDVFQRYRLAQELVEGMKNRRKFWILDVGGYPGHACDFLVDHNVVVLDKRICPKRNSIVGSGSNLPFRPGFFDIVLCVDTLEHFRRKDRTKLLNEILETAKDYVILLSPFDDKCVKRAERIVYEFTWKVCGARHEFLAEHVNYGLPDLEEVRKFLRRKSLESFEIPNGHLPVWLTMMLVQQFLTLLPDSDIVQRRLSQFYNLNVYPSDNRSPCYRTAIVISKRVTPGFSRLRACTIPRSSIYELPPRYMLDLQRMITRLSRLYLSSRTARQLKKARATFGRIAEYAKKLEREVEAKIKKLEEGAEYVSEIEALLRDKDAELMKATQYARHLELTVAAKNDELQKLTTYVRKLEAELKSKAWWT